MEKENNSWGARFISAGCPECRITQTPTIHLISWKMKPQFWKDNTPHGTNQILILWIHARAAFSSCLFKQNWSFLYPIQDLLFKEFSAFGNLPCRHHLRRWFTSSLIVFFRLQTKPCSCWLQTMRKKKKKRVYLLRCMSHPVKKKRAQCNKLVYTRWTLYLYRCVESEESQRLGLIERFENAKKK